MNRRTRHIAVVSIAVVTASIASFGVYGAVSRPAQQVETPSYFVVLAARALPTGTRVTREDVKVVAWPESNRIRAAATSIDAVVDRALLAPVVENEPLLETKMAPRGAGAGLSPTVRPGMRAISVKVNDVIGVAGFIEAGTRVDLLVTIRRRDESAARTVVSNVEVLTSGTRLDQVKARDVNSTPTPAAVVTLLVTPEDAERIALAQMEGQVVLVLRNPLDNEPTSSAGVRTGALFAHGTPEPPKVASQPRRAAVVAPPPAAPVKTAYTVEAIRAAKRSEEEVR